jgi:hypothetical protein
MNGSIDRRVLLLFDSSELNRNQRLGKMISKIDGDQNSWNKIYGTGSVRRFSNDIFGESRAKRQRLI